MLYANNLTNEKILAEPKLKGYCPFCREQLIPKCGKIKIKHWSHKSINDCDTWSEGETQWHLGWKALVKPKNCEVPIGNHRADIIGNYNKVIELQNSPISSKEIIERENHYKNMIWLFNGKEFINNIELRKKENIFTFRWKHPRKSMWFITKPLFIELPIFNKFDYRNQWYNLEEDIQYIFHMKKVFNNVPCGGYGILIKKKDFIKTYLSNVLKEDDDGK